MPRNHTGVDDDAHHGHEGAGRPATTSSRCGRAGEASSCRFKVGIRKTNCLAVNHIRKFPEIGKIVNMLPDRMNIIFDFGIPFNVVILEIKQEVGKLELLEVNNCVWCFGSIWNQ